jgi:hypothetical protein
MNCPNCITAKVLGIELSLGPKTVVLTKRALFKGLPSVDKGMASTPTQFVHASESIFGSYSQMCSFTVAVIWRSYTAVGGGCFAQQRRLKVVARAINGAVLGRDARRDCQAGRVVRTRVPGTQSHQIFHAESISVIYRISC